MKQYPFRCRVGGKPIASAIALSFAVFSPVMAAPTAQSAAMPVCWTAETLDVDTLASRMPNKQDIYQKCRDEALSAYAKSNPTPHPYDERVKKLIKLTTYLWVWGDTYHESLWWIASNEAQQLEMAGATDPVIHFMEDVTNESSIGDPASFNQRVDAFADSAYPNIFKLWYDTVAVAIEAKSASKPSSADANDAGTSVLADKVRKWGSLYEKLVQVGVSNIILYEVGDNMQDRFSNQERPLTLIHAEEVRALGEAAPDNPVRLALDGDYLIKEAWLARTSGWANSVTDAQWAQFRDYLAKADQVLEAAYEKYPNETEISQLMLDVELGQGQGRNRMEQWFQRAIQADPDNCEAYAGKLWYLQPRWYGSEQDLLDFGQECLATQNWAAGIPMTFTFSISQASDQDPTIYQRSEVWTPLEKVYRGILSHYPQSAFYRTIFAHHAVQGEHWDVAREQFDLLGEYWDRSVLNDATYSSDLQAIKANFGKVRQESSKDTSDQDTSSHVTSLGGWILTALYWIWKLL